MVRVEIYRKNDGNLEAEWVSPTGRGRIPIRTYEIREWTASYLVKLVQHDGVCYLFAANHVRVPPK